MDQTPDEIIREAGLTKFTGLKRTQIQHYIDLGQFPKPIKLGTRAKGWLGSEIRTWQNQRIAARDRNE